MPSVLDFCDFQMPQCLSLMFDVFIGFRFLCRFTNCNMESRHTFACKLCDLTFSTKLNFERHFESKKHVEVMKTLDSLVRIETSIESILLSSKLTGQKGSPFSCISKALVSSEVSERKKLANVWLVDTFNRVLHIFWQKYKVKILSF